MVVILVGPSGAGKTTLGAWAQDDLGLHWVEADIWAADGIDRHKLRAEWDAFYREGDPVPLESNLRARSKKDARSGTILTLPSPVILSPQLASAASGAGMAVVVVWGSGANCLAAFLDRERREARGLDEHHWRFFNQACVREYEKEIYTPFRINAFNGDGTRRSRPAMMDELRVMTNRDVA